MEGEVLIRTVGGGRMVADLADPLGRSLATSGMFASDAAKHELIHRLLRPGDVYVDAGANVGYYTVLAARIVGPSGHVYALEPAPSSFRSLRNHLRINGCEDNVTAIPAAAGAEVGRATLTGPPSGHDISSSLRPRDGETLATDVDVLPLGVVIAPEHRGRLKLVKIDVEGHEDAVLDGLEPLIADGVRPALIVELHTTQNPGGPGCVADLCARRGFRASWIVEDKGVGGRVAPIDRPLVLYALGNPPSFAAIPVSLYEVLLEPVETAELSLGDGRGR